MSKVTDKETHEVMVEFSKILKDHVEQQEALWDRITNIMSSFEKNVSFDMLPMKNDLDEKYKALYSKLDAIKEKRDNRQDEIVYRIDKLVNIKIGILGAILVISLTAGGVAFLDHFHQILDTIKGTPNVK